MEEFDAITFEKDMLVYMFMLEGLPFEEAEKKAVQEIKEIYSN